MIYGIFLNYGLLEFLGINLQLACAISVMSGWGVRLIGPGVRIPV